MTDLVKILCSTVLLLRKYEKIATKVSSIWNYVATKRDPHQKSIDPIANYKNVFYIIF